MKLGKNPELQLFQFLFDRTALVQQQLPVVSEDALDSILIPFDQTQVSPKSNTFLIFQFNQIWAEYFLSKLIPDHSCKIIALLQKLINLQLALGQNKIMIHNKSAQMVKG